MRISSLSAVIEPILAAHFESRDSIFVVRVLKKEKKSLDEGFLVIGQNRIYLFSRGKLDVETHFMDIQEVSSTGAEVRTGNYIHYMPDD